MDVTQAAVQNVSREFQLLSHEDRGPRSHWSRNCRRSCHYRQQRRDREELRGSMFLSLNLLSTILDWGSPHPFSVGCGGRVESPELRQVPSYVCRSFNHSFRGLYCPYTSAAVEWWFLTLDTDVTCVCVRDLAGEILYNQGLRKDRGQHRTTSQHGGASLGRVSWLTRFVLDLVRTFQELTGV